MERLNQTYLYEKDLLKKMLRKARGRVRETFGYENPKVRVELDKRIDFLEREFEGFDYAINPYHVQPGIILDVDITSIKRKRYVLGSMANVLNEFLNGVSKGFQDAAFASFKRRRSTIRDDINQSFADEPEETQAVISSQSMDAVKSRGDSPPAKGGKAKPKGKADVTPSRKRKVNLDELSEM